MPAVLALGVGRFFSSLFAIVFFFWPKTSRKESPYAESNTLFSLSLLVIPEKKIVPHLLHLQQGWSLSIRPHHYGKDKIPSLETFTFNMTKPNVTSNAMLFRGFRQAAKRDLSLAYIRI